MAHPRIHPGPFGVPALLLVLAAPAHASWAGAQLKTLEVDTAAPATLTLTALAEPPGRIGVRRVDPATGIAAITPLDPAAGPLELTLEPRETLILLFREAQPGTCLEAVLTLAADPAGTLGWFSLRLDPEAEANPWTLTSRSLHRDCRLALRDGHTLRIQHRPPAAGAPGSQAGAGASLETKARQAGAGCPSLLGLAAKADRLQASLRALGERGEYLQAFERVERQYDKEVASQERLVGLRDRQIERVQELKALVRQEGGTPQDFARARQLRDEAQELDRQILGEYRSFQAFLERDLEFADDRIAFLDGKLQEVALRAKAAADPGELANHLNCQYTLWHQRMLWLDHWFSVGDLQATTGQALARAEGATRIFAGCAEEVARYLHAHEITPALKLALDEAEAKREAERCEAKAAELARRERLAAERRHPRAAVPAAGAGPAAKLDPAARRAREALEAADLQASQEARRRERQEALERTAALRALQREVAREEAAKESASRSRKPGAGAGAGAPAAPAPLKVLWGPKALKDLDQLDGASVTAIKACVELVETYGPDFAIHSAELLAPVADFPGLLELRPRHAAALVRPLLVREGRELRVLRIARDGEKFKREFQRHCKDALGLVRPGAGAASKP